MPPRYREDDGHDQLVGKAHEMFGAFNTLPPEILQFPSKENEYTVIVRAGVSFIKDGVTYVHFALGDAAQNSLATDMRPHYIRMAESRGRARALRLATNSRADDHEEEAKPRRSVPIPEKPAVELLRKDQWTELAALGKDVHGWTEVETVAWVKKELDIVNVRQATAAQAKELYNKLFSEKAKKQVQPELPSVVPPEDKDTLRRKINSKLTQLLAVGSTMKPPGPKATETDMEVWLTEASRIINDAQ